MINNSLVAQLIADRVVKKLLIVANVPSDNTRALASATLRGASHEDIDGVEAQLLQPLEADANAVLNADGIIIGTTENFAYMSGLIKDFFERVYYPCLEQKQGLPFGLYIRAGSDGTGTKLAIEKILTGLRWKAVAPPLILQGDYTPDFEVQCEELGMLLAAGLEAGIV